MVRRRRRGRAEYVRLRQGERKWMNMNRMKDMLMIMRSMRGEVRRIREEVYEGKGRYEIKRSW